MKVNECFCDEQLYLTFSLLGGWMEGKCLKGPSCTYNHTKDNLIKSWQDMFAELRASPFNPNKHLNPGNTKTTYNTPQPKILQCIVEDIVD